MSEQTLQPRYLTGAEGKEYDWMRDHIFVKLTSAEAGGPAGNRHSPPGRSDPKPSVARAR